MDLFTQLNAPLERQDLQAPPTLTHQFSEIRNLLAGEASGSTLDIRLVEQLMDLLLCKLCDEQTRKPGEELAFQKRPDDSNEDVWQRLNNLLETVKQQPRINSVFDTDTGLSLDSEIAVKVVQSLQRFELTGAERDVLGEAFETFMGPSLRGEKGQFFTPRNVARLACSILNPRDGELIVDPACGTGGFLTEAQRVSENGDPEVKAVGIDKDQFLARIAAIQLALLAPTTESWAFSSDSLQPSHQWPDQLQSNIQPGTVDVVVTNPPFGRRISVNPKVLEGYDLGHKWRRQGSEPDITWIKGESIDSSTPPQVVFVERCLQLLRPGGRMGIVLPDGVLGNVSTGYIRQYVASQADVVAIIDLPLETFLPSTSTKTSLLFLRKRKDKDSQSSIFMAVPEHCGHDRRGKPIRREDGSLKDDFPQVAEAFRQWRETNAPDF